MAAYARRPVARALASWFVAGNQANLAAAIAFPTPAFVPPTSALATHFGLGTAPVGAGELIHLGPIVGALGAGLLILPGVTPKLDESTRIIQATGDGMSMASAEKYLKHLLQNERWPNLGDIDGLRGSVIAGNLFLSLHFLTPDEGGNQTINEISYT